MIGLVLALTLAAEPPGRLSPAGQSLVDQISRSIETVRAHQAALPPPKDDAERILRLGELDQAPRLIITRYDFSTIPDAERAAATAEASALIAAVDKENQRALLRLVPSDGWFLKSRYGEKAGWAAFDIIQHADLDLQERFLPVIGRFAPSGEAPGDAYGMMYDRVEIQYDRPQLYGTQFRCDGGKWRPYPIADPAHLAERRRSLGFIMDFAEYKAHFDNDPPCPQTGRPPPPGMKLD